MNIAKEVASRSTCFRALHGCVIVGDDQIVATGYVGAPRKTKDCFERGNCLRRELNVPSGHRYELCRSVHAEQNAIINAARAGADVLGTSMFIYSEKIDDNEKSSPIDAYPCFICKKMIINSGIKEVVCHQKDGSLKVYSVSDWVADWQEKDLVDDMQQYGSKTIKE